MRFLSDATLDHLRAVTEEPDFSATRYAIIREIGRGGMGVVYEAEDADLGRRVAVKVLATEVASEESVARLREEARTIARLEHPGIVPVHDSGLLPDGRAWYAMKLVRGTSLQEFLATPRPRTEILRIFLRMCEPVAFAHAHGVVHRDLKPENVMIGSFGEVLVMDWGVAHLVTQRPASNVVAGTRGFMSPEQERGEGVDPRADVFSLGQILKIVCNADGKPVPKQLRAILAKATSTDAAARYSDAAALAADVALHLEGEPVSAHRENAAERSMRWLNRNRALVAMVLAYLIMRVIVFFYGRT